MQLIKSIPWLPFLVMALIAQQVNMLAYKLGGEQALPQVFLVYSFFIQSLINSILLITFRNKGFPLVLKGRMRLWILWVAAIYVLNEMTFMSIYRMGAPYSLSMTIFSLTGIVILTFFGLLVLKEKIALKQIAGIVLALISIVLIRMG